MKIAPAKRISSVQEYYFSRKFRDIDKMRKRGIHVINLGIGNPDLPPSDNTIRKLVESGKHPDAHGYQSYIGINALREAFAKWYKKYFNVNLDAKLEILPLLGSKEGIMHISMAFLDPGDEVLIPNPGYLTYRSVSKLMGAEIKTYNLVESNNWLPDFKELESKDLSNVKLMWVNYPHMPTGARASVELFKHLIEFAEKHNILICNDNPYSFILNDKPLSILSINGAKETAIELNSLSKSHNMAGWRMGMVVGNAEYLFHILRVKSNMDSGMFLPIQLAAIEALKNPISWYDKLNDNYTKRRRIVWDMLEAMDCQFLKDQVGIFVWSKIPEKYSSAEELSDLILQKAHVFITPGYIFGSNGERYIRISLCNDEEKLLEAKYRILRLLV